jgi:hypothetical protein
MLSVFISSAGDVDEERMVTAEVVRDVSKTLEDNLGISFRPLGWESLDKSVNRSGDNVIQARINPLIDKCDVFLLILGKRYGTMHAGSAISRLESEINRMIERLPQGPGGPYHSTPAIMAYFSTLGVNSDPGDQEKAVRALRSRLQGRVFYGQYTSPEGLRTTFTHDLYRLALGMQHRTRKHEALRSFWHLGRTDRQEVPELAVVYAPVDRAFMGSNFRSPFWQERLVPHIVFEDHKALMKIEKTLRIAGHRNFRFYDDRNIPNTINEMNRVWVCIRNRAAQEALRQRTKNTSNLTAQISH